MTDGLFETTATAGVGSRGFDRWFQEGDNAPVPKMAYEDWDMWGMRLRQRGCKLQWKIIAWLLYGENTYGERFVQAAEASGYEPEYLKKLLWVGTATVAARTALIPAHPGVRDLPFTFFEAVAPFKIPEDDKHALLITAAEKNLGHQQFIALVKEFRKLRGIPDERSPKLNPPPPVLGGRAGVGGTASEIGHAVAAQLPARESPEPIPDNTPDPFNDDTPAVVVLPSPVALGEGPGVRVSDEEWMRGENEHGCDTGESAVDLDLSRNPQSAIRNPQLLDAATRMMADRLIAYFFAEYHTETDQDLFETLVSLTWEDIFGELISEESEAANDA